MKCRGWVLLAALLALGPAAREARAQVLRPLPGDSGRGRSRPRPVFAWLEGLGVSVIINRIDAWGRNVDWAKVTPKSWAANLRQGWAWDTDGFMENMFAHPLNGAMYFNAGRDNGLTFFESAPLAFLGSAEWEYFGETEHPSLNDFYNTSFGGIVLGEMGHRLADLVRDNTARGTGRVLRELAALPLDPVGGLNRVLRGQFTRVGPNPDDREPHAFGLQFQAGGQVAQDSASGAHASLSSSFLLDIAYGNPFDRRTSTPFDVFRVRIQASPEAGGVSLLNARGRLYAYELTDSMGAIRSAITVSQRFEYRNTPAYRFGAQSVGTGIVSGYALGHGVDLQSEAYGEVLLMAGVNAPGTAVPGSGAQGTGFGVRTYDFGPGAGLDLGASLRVKGTPVVAGRLRWAYVHSVSGAPANHFLQFASIEAQLPLTRYLGIGVYSGFYQRRSKYGSNSGETHRFPELRGYVSWRTSHGLSIPEPR